MSHVFIIAYSNAKLLDKEHAQLKEFHQKSYIFILSDLCNVIKKILSFWNSF